MPEIKNVFTKKDYQLVVFNFKDFMGTLETRFKKDLEWDEEINFYFAILEAVTFKFWLPQSNSDRCRFVSQSKIYSSNN